METLRQYLNSLDPLAQAAYAKRCGTTIGYLRKALSIKQNFDGALVRLLWDHSRGEVSRHELRPDIWTLPEHDIWPEVAQQRTAA
jgi:hypothetical protein